jgi:hypothetical protein
VGWGTHGDDTFVAFAESLESVGVVQVHSLGPLLITCVRAWRMTQRKERRRTWLFARTCLCTAARVAVVAAVVKPEWAREEGVDHPLALA